MEFKKKKKYEKTTFFSDLDKYFVKDFYSTTFISSFLNTLKLEESRTKKEEQKKGEHKYFVWKFKKKNCPTKTIF